MYNRDTSNKNFTFCIFWSLLLPLCFTISKTFSQDVILYADDLYFGPSYPLKINQSVDLDDCVSIKFFNSEAAVYIRMRDDVVYGRTGPYKNMFLYTEEDQPFIGDAYQYCDHWLRISCVRKGALPPQPELFIPVDIENVHPLVDTPVQRFVPNDTMLVLRKAFFWENSEETGRRVGSPHGPYGDIKIAICDISVTRFNFYELFHNQPLWESRRLPLNNGRVGMTLPGPIWSGYEPQIYPDPYSEWIDGPWGCIYSNIALWDWSANPSLDSVAVIVYETDGYWGFWGSPDDILGYMKVTPETLNKPINFRVRMYGWITLENKIVDPSGEEPSVDLGQVYWYGSWDGSYPEEVYGPQNDAIPTQTSPGSQYHPFTDTEFWAFYNNSAFDGYTVGLLGKNFEIPGGVLKRPRIFKVIDKERPAILKKKND